MSAESIVVLVLIALAVGAILLLHINSRRNKTTGDDRQSGALTGAPFRNSRSERPESSKSTGVKSQK